MKKCNYFNHQSQCGTPTDVHTQFTLKSANGWHSQYVYDLICITENKTYRIRGMPRTLCADFTSLKRALIYKLWDQN